MSAPRIASHAFLDTNVIVSAIVTGADNSASSQAYCERLVNTAARVYMSRIVRLELSQAILKLATKPGRLPSTTRERFNLDAWDVDFLIRHRWMDHGVREFDRLIGEFWQVLEYPLDERVWRRSVRIMSQYRLQSHDAVHVATAQELGVLDFVTSDDHFRRVDGLNLIFIRD